MTDHNQLVTAAESELEVFTHTDNVTTVVRGWAKNEPVSAGVAPGDGYDARLKFARRWVAQRMVMKNSFPVEAV